MIKISKWKIVNLDGENTIKIQCPECNVWSYLSDHEIDENGYIKPSIVCDCGFHNFVTLNHYRSFVRGKL